MILSSCGSIPVKRSGERQGGRGPEVASNQAIAVEIVHGKVIDVDPPGQDESDGNNYQRRERKPARMPEPFLLGKIPCRRKCFDAVSEEHQETRDEHVRSRRNHELSDLFPETGGGCASLCADHADSGGQNPTEEQRHVDRLAEIAKQRRSEQRDRKRGGQQQRRAPEP